MRQLSTAALNSMFDGTESEAVWLVLLHVDHPTLTLPFRLVANTEDITSNGEGFAAYPFEITLAPDDGTKLPEVQLTIDNVDRTLVEIIRTLQTPPAIKIQVVLAQQPNTVEIEISNMVLREVSYNAYSITGTLYADDILNARFPEGTMSKASGYFGLFR